MKLFARTGGHWLFYISALYFIGATWGVYKGADISLLSPLYIFFLALPFVLPPLGRSMNLDITWDKKMFDFFRNKTAKEYTEEASNVYNLPAPKAVPPVPEVKKEEPAKIYYRLGLTDNNRVAFSMGYSEITMNEAGVQQMIDQLEFFKDQLYNEGPSGGPDDGGGEPIPVPEQKAA